MFMYMQYAGWMARMDGRRIERARARIEEGRGKRSRGKRRRIEKNNNNNNNIYKPTRHFTPIIIININNTINQHHFFQKPSKSNPTTPKPTTPKNAILRPPHHRSPRSRSPFGPRDPGWRESLRQWSTILLPIGRFGRRCCFLLGW